MSSSHTSEIPIRSPEREQPAEVPAAAPELESELNRLESTEREERVRQQAELDRLRKLRELARFD